MGNWLLYEVNAEIFAVLLLVSSTVSLIMGLQSLIAGLLAINGRVKWRRLDVSLGLYMLTDAITYSVIAISMLRDSEPLPAWSLIIILAMIVAPVMVFVALAGERMKGGG